MENKIELILMRHARSRADDENVHEGRYDSPLTDAGREQVRLRAAFFAAQGCKPDLIIASTLVRAQESAQIIGSVLGVAVQTDADWMEFNNGPLAGLPFEDARAQYPRPVFRNPYEPFHETGESEVEFHNRLSRALERIIRRGSGSYLVVSHGGALNAALRVALNIPYPVNNAGVWFEFSDTSFVSLEYYPGKHVWIVKELKRE